jgi:hypothetical protein
MVPDGGHPSLGRSALGRADGIPNADGGLEGKFSEPATVDVGGRVGQRLLVTTEEATRTATSLRIDFAALGCDLDQFRRGMEVELEHGLRSPDTNVTNDGLIQTGKIALAHLRELPDYYDRLAVMEVD